MQETWIQILKEHTERYPLMKPQDYGKLIFQSEFGAEHMIEDEESVRAFLLKEWEELSQDSSPKAVEDIGGALCRFPLAACTCVEAAELLTRLFLLTAQADGEREKSVGPLKEKIELSIQYGVPGMEKWAAEWLRKGCPAVRHSAVFHDTYHPHYRLLRKEYAGYFPALLEILKIAGKVMAEKGSAGGERAAVIAIDGRCGSGKTSFAKLVGGLFSCNVFHMDDYYLPFESRKENWRSVPGGNMDLERFLQEVLLPAKAGEQVIYCPYDCQKCRMKEKKIFEPCLLTVVEGSYAHHPMLSDDYDLKIFLTCSGTEQESRLRAREGEYFTAFAKQWIPMEENYFAHFAVEERSDILVNTDKLF